jgi:hypothetical protein
LRQGQPIFSETDTAKNFKAEYNKPFYIFSICW